MKILLARAQPGLGFSLHLVPSSPLSGRYKYSTSCYLFFAGFSHSIPSSCFSKKDPVANLFYPDIIMTSHSIFPVRYMVLLISLYC
jgi:hypothetical protein